jgi:hypothetical protein
MEIATSHDGGATFGASRLVASPVCECCRPALAQAPGGRIFAAWRDARLNAAGKTVRDIGVAAYDRRLASEIAARVAVADGWVYEGCPHAGPALATFGERLFLGWFSGQGPRPGLRLAASDDGGHTFAAPIELLADTYVPPSTIALAAADADSLAVAWEDLRAQQPSIQVSTLPAAGSLSAPASRVQVAGRHPALAAGHGRLYLAWADEAEVRLLVVSGG